MSLFADFCRECGHRQIIENESGFITFHVELPLLVVDDVFVVPAQRKSRVASCFVDQAAAVGRDRGCTTVVTSVFLNNKVASESTLAILKHGFKLQSADGGRIIFAKEI